MWEGRYIFDRLISFFMDIYYLVRFMGHWVILFLYFEEISHCSSQWIYKSISLPILHNCLFLHVLTGVFEHFEVLFVLKYLFLMILNIIIVFLFYFPDNSDIEIFLMSIIYSYLLSFDFVILNLFSWAICLLVIECACVCICVLACVCMLYSLHSLGINPF